MLEGGKITNSAAVCVIIATILPTSTVFLPAIMFKYARQDSWISVVALTFFGFIAALIIAFLGMRFSGRTIIQYSEDIVGKVLGKVIGLVYILSFIYLNAAILREFSNMFNTAFMPETPARVFAVGIVLASAYAVRGGLEVLARTCEFVTPMSLLILVISFIMIYQEIDVMSFLPVLERGFIPILQGTYIATIFFGEVIVMTMVIPFLNRPFKAGRSMVLAVLISGIFQLLITASMIGVFGCFSGSMEFPTLQLVRYIRVADLLDRIEPFIVLIWVAGAIVKVGVLHYCAVLGIAQWLNLKEYHALILPVGALLITLSTILWENVIQLSHIIVSVLPPYGLALEVGLPFVLLVVARLRGMGDRQ